MFRSVRIAAPRIAVRCQPILRQTVRCARTFAPHRPSPPAQQPTVQPPIAGGSGGGNTGSGGGGERRRGSIEVTPTTAGWKAIAGFTVVSIGVAYWVGRRSVTGDDDTPKAAAGSVALTEFGKKRAALLASQSLPAKGTPPSADPIGDATARAAAGLGMPLSSLTASADLSHRPAQGMVDAIGWTPLIELTSLSKLTGCRILAKAEFMNAGGSVKDRPAKFMIEQAEADGRLAPPGTGVLVEGTGGNTGIGLALIARAKGYKLILTMPTNVSSEKVQFMRDLGADVHVVPAVPYSDPNHFMHVAKRLAESTPHAFFTNQFDNTSNALAHYTTTGPEIAQQSGGVGAVDALIVMAGTGGTISGLTNYFKERNASFRSYLMDCSGSGYASYVTSNEFKSDGGSTVLEGVGIARQTANFELVKPLVDGAFRGTDREAIEMCYYLLKHEGLFVGPSAAMNVVGAVKLARQLQAENATAGGAAAGDKRKTIVTVLCDGGDRYKSKVYNAQFLKDKVRDV